MTDKESWQKVEQFIENLTGKIPLDLKGYLFLIGVQTLGKGRRVFSKEEKQDLIHIAVCEIFTDKGYYKLSHRDDDGWPHYEVITKIPHQKLFGQEDLLKEQVIHYFQRENLI
jgi:hypothetical protein